MRFLTRILPLAIVALAPPASAAAKPRNTVAPPGDSGITQYLEVVPTAAGPAPPGSGPAGGKGVAPALTDAQRGRLDSLGPDGRTLASVVDATAPEPAGTTTAPRPATPLGRAGAQGNGESQVSGSATDSSKGSPEPGGSAASLVFDAVGWSGGGALGVLLPVFMLTSALAAAAYGIWRRRMRL